MHIANQNFLALHHADRGSRSSYTLLGGSLCFTSYCFTTKLMQSCTIAQLCNQCPKVPGGSTRYVNFTSMFHHLVHRGGLGTCAVHHWATQRTLMTGVANLPELQGAHLPAQLE